MKYYRIDHIEGHNKEGPVVRAPRAKQALAWAELERRDGEWFLVYRTDADFSVPVAERRCTRRPRITPNGFFCEVEEKGKVGMLRFTEYHGKRESRGKGDGSAFTEKRA